VRVSEGGEKKIEFMAWVRHVTGESRRRQQQKGGPGKEGRALLLDGERTVDVAVDLPQELAFLEVETALPKLSLLPVSGGSG
jgi:anaphase-promoting complex subunit 4